MSRTRRVMLMIEVETDIPMKLLRSLKVWQATIKWAETHVTSSSGRKLNILQIQANVVKKGKK